MAIKMIRYTPARFLSVCGTWIYRLLPALHAHLSCTILLNSGECALSERRRRRRKEDEIVIRNHRNTEPSY